MTNGGKLHKKDGSIIMREIKFRAWDGMSPFYFFNVSSGLYGIEDPVIEQFTGLKDKNGEGELIYDDDVVYLAGYGNYHVEYPYAQLFESLYEGDVEGVIGFGGGGGGGGGAW